MKKSIFSFVIVVIVAVIAAFIPIKQAAAAEVCDLVGVNAAKVHAAFVNLPQGQSIESLAAAISESKMPAAEKRTLIGGLVFLVDYYSDTGTYPDVDQFALAARHFCQQFVGKQRSI